jgi:ribosomal protein L34E
MQKVRKKKRKNKICKDCNKELPEGVTNDSKKKEKKSKKNARNQDAPEKTYLKVICLKLVAIISKFKLIGRFLTIFKGILGARR